MFTRFPAERVAIIKYKTHLKLTVHFGALSYISSLHTVWHDIDIEILHGLI